MLGESHLLSSRVHCKINVEHACEESFITGSGVIPAIPSKPNTFKRFMAHRG